MNRLLCSLALLLSASAVADNQLFIDSELAASSPALPMYQFVHDWQGSLAHGDYAYAQARFSTGVRWQGFELSAQKRYYAYLAFNPAAAKLYYNSQNKLSTPAQSEVSLRLKMFEAEGIKLAKRVELGQFFVEGAYTGYRFSRYQVGQVQGNVAGDQGLSVSASIDYHYDQDKLLADPQQGGSGGGDALDIRLGWVSAQWQLELAALDAYNHWQVKDAAYTRGCVNLAGNATQVCSSGEATAHSNLEDYSFTIATTWQAKARYAPWLLEFYGQQHGRYQRLSLQKDWHLGAGGLGLLGVSAHSTEQVGVHWRSRYHQLSLLTDHYNYQRAKQLQLEFGLRLPF